MIDSTVTHPVAANVAQVAAGSFAVLDSWAAIDASGRDAASFLQSQLSADISGAAPRALVLAGYCTPQGRLLASLLVARHDHGLRLVGGRDVLPGAMARLRMYILRAQVQLADPGHRVLGIYGDAGALALVQAGLAAPAARALAWHGTACVLGLPSVSYAGHTIRRWLVVAPQDEHNALAARLAGQLRPVPEEVDRWLEVLAGWPRITQATSEAYVPQMVNLELIGGVSFDKGCYPGQEVVVRLQHRGTTRRRMFAARLERLPSAPAAWQPGAPVLAAGKEIGSVVLSAHAPDGGGVALVEYRMQAARGSRLELGEAPLLPLPLPYDVPEAASCA